MDRADIRAARYFGSLMAGFAVPYLVALVVGGAVFPSIQILLSFVQKALINSVEFGRHELISTALKLSGAIVLIVFVISPIAEYVRERASLQMLYAARCKVAGHLLELGRSYFDHVHTGDVLSRVSNDLNPIGHLYSYVNYRLVTAIIYGIGSMVAMVAMSRILVVVVLPIAAVEVVCTLAVSARLRRLSDKIQSEIAEANKAFMDVVRGMKVIRVFRVGSVMLSRYLDRSNCVYTESIQRGRISSRLSALSDLFTFINLLGVLGAGVLLLQRGLVDLGTVAAFIVLQDGVSYMFCSLSDYLPSYITSISSARRVKEILDVPPDTSGVTRPMTVSIAREDSHRLLELRDVRFAYAGDRGKTFSISLAVEKGEVAAVVGKSGCGKSTLLRLILGFYPLKEREILLEGVPCSSLTSAAIRERIAYVPQDPQLVVGTVEDNVRLGRMDARFEDVELACKAAAIHETIAGLPNGYATQVGGTSEGFSRGEAKRIMLARAFLRNAPLLLLDEPTSGLDLANEAAISREFDGFLRGRTVLMVTHHPWMLARADVVHVVEGGTVVESGTHEDLRRSSRRYGELGLS